MDTYGQEIAALMKRLAEGENFLHDWKRLDPAGDLREHLSNTFHATDEDHKDCHDYPFTVTVQYDHPGTFTFVSLDFPPEQPCCGGGLKEYVRDEILKCLKAPVTWRPEFLVGIKWTLNQQIFATEAEAIRAGQDGMDSWHNVDDFRAIESDLPANWAYDEDGKAINLRRVKK